MEAARKARRRRVRRGLLLGLVVAVLGTVVAGTALWQKLDGNIQTDNRTSAALSERGVHRPAPAPEGVRNVLVMGSDLSPDVDTARSDTTMLLHLSRDGRRAELVSVPRDMYTKIPACRRSEGEGHIPAQRTQFNMAFQLGGAACTIRTVEEMTGVRIDHHVTVGFSGFKNVVDALGGVPLELPEEVRDSYVGRNIPEGTEKLNGEQALSFVRAREFVGDGSDLSRIERQQQFLRAILSEVRRDGFLKNPARSYRVLNAATSSLTTDSGLASISKLYGLAKRLDAVSDGGISYATVPNRPAPGDPNRLVADEPSAQRLFASLREDRPLPDAKTL